MKFGKIVGNIVATRKNEILIGSKLMVVQPIDVDGKCLGSTLIAVDTVGSGIGELVFLTEGTSARVAVNNLNSPIDAAIVGIVDSIDVLKEQ